MFSVGTLGACLLALVTPSIAYAAPKNYGVRGLQPRDSACTNSPSTRSCWQNGFSTATDMDDKWPSTGKTVTVRHSTTLT